jgi:hypothetical protein
VKIRARSGTGSAARFGQLAGIVVDAAGHVYAADQSFNCIIRVTPWSMNHKIRHNDSPFVAAPTQ